MKNKILVVGSAVEELVLPTESLPSSGETAAAGGYRRRAGGGGVTVTELLARYGESPLFCGRVGNDIAGNDIVAKLKACGADTRFLVRDRAVPTGLEVVLVEHHGLNRVENAGGAANANYGSSYYAENESSASRSASAFAASASTRFPTTRNLFYPGANARLSTSDVDEAFLSYPDALALQLELPMDVCAAAAGYAAELGVPVFADGGRWLETLSGSLGLLDGVEVFLTDEKRITSLTGIEATTMQNCLQACMALSAQVKSKYIVLRLDSGSRYGRTGTRGTFVYDGTYFELVAPEKDDVFGLSSGVNQSAGFSTDGDKIADGTDFAASLSSENENDEFFAAFIASYLSIFQNKNEQLQPIKLLTKATHDAMRKVR